MKRTNKSGWIIGLVITSALCLFMLLLLIVVVADSNTNSGPSMSVEEMSGHCYRSSELYCAGIYYTDKALTTDPQAISYQEWQGYVSQANEYWDELNDSLSLIASYADTEGFHESFEATKLEARFTDKLSATILPRVSAYDSEEIIRTFNGGQAGKRLKAVADLLGKDMKYAQQALAVANGQVTADSWNDFADTAMHIEAGLRVVKTAGQGAAVCASALLATDPLTALETTTVVVSGASCIWQLLDDGAFIMMGDDYKSSEFVVNLAKVSDAVAPIALAGGMLTMDFTGKAKSAMLSSITVADTLRGLFQDGKIAGIQLTASGGQITSMTKAELLEYKRAKENGQKLPAEIDELLRILEDDTAEELPVFKVSVNKPKAFVEEKVEFTVLDVDPEYTYIWEYGNNKNPQETNKFNYSYQKAGIYTMYVTILNQDGLAIGKGSCPIEVVDMPIATPGEGDENTPELRPEDRPTNINVVGRYVYNNKVSNSVIELHSDNTYTYTNTNRDYQLVEQGTYDVEKVTEESGTYYRMNAKMTDNITTYTDPATSPTTSQYSFIEPDTFIWYDESFDGNGNLISLNGLHLRE